MINKKIYSHQLKILNFKILQKVKKEIRKSITRLNLILCKINKIEILKASTINSFIYNLKLIMIKIRFKNKISSTINMIKT